MNEQQVDVNTLTTEQLKELYSGLVGQVGQFELQKAVMLSHILQIGTLLQQRETQSGYTLPTLNKV